MATAKDKKSDTVTKKRVFVISPIGAVNSPEREHADFVLNGAIRPVFELAGYDVIRADTMADPSMISDGIFNHIFEAEVCVADLTYTNANVYYELGVRHAQSLPVIHIAENGTRLPFDNSPHNTIFFSRANWSSFEDLKKSLSAQLSTIESDDFVVSNPITHARGRLRVSKSGDAEGQLIAGLLERMDSLENFQNTLARLPLGGERINGPRIADRVIVGGSRIVGRDDLSGSGSPQYYSASRSENVNFSEMVELCLAIVDFLQTRKHLRMNELSVEFANEFRSKLEALSMTQRERLLDLVLSRSEVAVKIGIRNIRSLIF